MEIIRNRVFETNSSSTHSICIAKSSYRLPNSISFNIGEYGWENDSLTDSELVDYLYTGLLICDRQDDIEKLRETLENNGVSCTFQKPKYINSNGYKYLDYGHIDHSGELCDFLDSVMSDEDMLFRYLFANDSVVYTGNDNSSDSYALCNSADATVYDWNKRESVPNPNHHPDKFDYFDKGN